MNTLIDDNLLKIVTALVAAFFTAIVALLLYFLKKKDDELALIKNKISDKKYEAYFSIVSLFYDVLKQQKNLAQFTNDELALRYIDIKKNLFLLGSDDIIKKFSEFDKGIISDNLNPVYKIKSWLELFLLIRKDSGNPKTKLTIDDLLRSILKEADYADFNKLIKKTDNFERKSRLTQRH